MNGILLTKTIVLLLGENVLLSTILLFTGVQHLGFCDQVICGSAKLNNYLRIFGHLISYMYLGL